MVDFNVIFSGLICHIRLNDYARAAVIVRDPNHNPLLWVKKSGLVGTPTFVPASPLDPNWKVFNIAPDARILLSGLVPGNGVADPPSPAVALVEELIPAFEPDDALLATYPHPWVAGYVEYRGGDLSATCFYEDKARFRKGDNFSCRAKELRWKTQSTGNTVDIIDAHNNQTMKVRADTIVAFTQLDKLDSAGDHKLYKKVSKRAVTPLDIETTGKCTSTGCELPLQAFTSVTVECVSTQWP